MSHKNLSSIPWFDQNWPKAADQRSADLFSNAVKEAWVKNNKDPVLIQQPGIVRLIHAIGGNSPFLADLIIKNIHFFEYLILNGPDKACNKAFTCLQNSSIQESRSSIAKILRITKQKIAIACAIADVGNVWTLKKITHTLSYLAEITLHFAINYLLLQAHQNKKITLSHPENPQENSGFIVLGMGKLGGRELNYSSDIDLIILYDPDKYPNHPDLATLFIRITRQLVSLMEDRDENGYVFRVDLRLRPDPSSSPLAVSLPAAISYYESLGQTWERSAMSKARPVAGDLAGGYSFLEAVQPFIWRRHLDFAVVEDIYAMKNRIDCHKNSGKPNPPILFEKKIGQDALHWLIGQNVKLGYGGIREIEFLPQTLQLIWGGRFPKLRTPQTIKAIQQLTRKELISDESATILIKTYYFLRKIEHRLQMQSDYQTHSLPNTQQAFDAFCIFMGYESTDKFVEDLFPLMQKVRHIFEGFFTSPDNEENFILDLPKNELINYLNEKGFPDEAASILQSWSNSGPRTLRTARARMILKNILPNILQAFAEQKNPLLILQRFDSLLARHHAGIQLLSLFERNPILIEKLASILGSSQFMADYITNNPAALDALIHVDILKTKTNLLQKTIHEHLNSTQSLEEILPILHNIIQSEEFRLSVSYMENRLSLNKSQIQRTRMADIILNELLARVIKDHEQKYGIIPDGGICIIILGKAGSWEMTVGSDLDMMLVYDHPPEIAASVAETGLANKAFRSLAINPYYIRLTQSFITALTNTSYTGPLYEIDMRLRPSGSKGPVAVSLNSFQRYHEKEAWTWERMALTRARVIGGPKILQDRINNAINKALDFSPSGVTNKIILQDAVHMRKRLENDMPPTTQWDVKYLKGGLIEVEFIAQTLQLISHNNKVRHPCTRIAFRKLAQNGYLSIEEARYLIQADYFWRNLQSLLRLFFGKYPPEHLEMDATPIIIEIMTEKLLGKIFHTKDSFSLIMEKIHQTSEQVRGLFIKLLGPVT